MYIHFKPEVYERLKFLSDRDEISLAAYVARQMEALANEKVVVEYSIKEEEKVPEIPLVPVGTVGTSYGGEWFNGRMITTEINGGVGKSPI